MTSTSAKPAYDPTELHQYLASIMHSWMKTLAVLAFSLIPFFFILDVFMMPAELLPRFAIYRGVASVLVFIQYLVLRITEPSRWSQVHGYLFTLILAAMVSLMTTDLGGFNSTYYAGLSLTVLAVIITVPWKLLQSAFIPVITVAMYVAINLIVPQEEPVEIASVVNNFYFLGGTSIVVIGLQYVKMRLIIQEFEARCDLRAARDALWGEMEVAKQIQTSLLPAVHELPGYHVAATMEPADEVGGDYYDIIETEAGEVWLLIGDVSGHGVESGLIMMMTQTSIYTTVNRTAGLEPSKVLDQVNAVIKENISRLGTERYMTVTATRLGPDEITFAGKHQDILIHHGFTGETELVPTTGTWIGILDDLSGTQQDATRKIQVGDIVLLFTDGVTESADADGEMFGDERLRQALTRYATLEVDHIVSSIMQDVKAYMHRQDDDLTLLAIKRKS